MVRIIVPVNFSDYSLNALNYAVTLGQKFSSEITLLHCFAETLEDVDVMSASDSAKVASIHDVETIETKKLNDLKQHIEKGFSVEQKSNIVLKIRFETGYPEDIIIAISLQEDPDVIVMGTKSKGETIKELLGSITSDVIKKARVPVLAVPAESKINLDQISHVLFATDFGMKDYSSLHKLIRLIAPFNTIIHSVHFCTSEPDKWDKKKLEELRNYCRTTYRNHQIEFEFITGDDFVETLDRYISEVGIDLIAMTRRKRNMISQLFHPSITRKILFHTDIPLLVFHE